EVVAIYRDGVYLGNATVVGGIWSFQDSGLMNGSYSYTAQVQDAAGNAGASSQATLTVDTIAPADPTTAPSGTDDQAPITGPIAAGSSTNDNTPLLSGTGTVGQTITVYDGNT
ncbi:Ig-like domain-containing protein, partial [Acinetobacter soli]